MLGWLAVSQARYHAWQKRRTQPLQCRHQIPKSHWLLPWEVEAIIAYRYEHLDEGYRPLTYMMLDENIVAVSPSSVYRVLKVARLLWPPNRRHGKAKGSGFVQPLRPHEHWHLDVSYINFKGTFVYLVALIDGYSRYIVHDEIRTSVEALDVEILLERARQRFPGTNPILITDNGPQFIAKEFKNYLALVGITHRRTRFFYPQSNGKIERFMQTCKNESIRRYSVLDLQDLKRQVERYIEYYNTRRLHSSLGYITPLDMLCGNQQRIFAERRAKLQQARQLRKNVQTTSWASSSSRTLANSMRSEDRSQGPVRALGPP